MANPAGGQPPSTAGLPPQPPPKITQASTTTNNNPTTLDYSKIFKPAAMNSAMHVKATEGKEQWKEVKGNRVRTVTNQKGTQGNNETTGKELVPAGREIVAVEKVAEQSVQTTNKFVVLEVQEDENNKNNQLALVEDNSKKNSPVQKTNESENLNLNVQVIKPTVSRIASSKVDNQANLNEGRKGDKEMVEQCVPKEATAHWVSRTFGGNVATNQSCQEIPSQSWEFTAIDRIPEGDEREQLNGKKLWHQQTEVDSEEGELPDGATGEEESSDEQNDKEEQSVN
ncbi:hypothetical protein A4A49_58912, partial [Nicotiana attenuata]